MSFNLITILAALSTFILPLLSIHLFLVKTGNLFLNRVLAAFFISRFFENVIFILIFSGMLVHFPSALKIFSPLSYAAPALFFIYVQGFLKDKSSFSRVDWFHLIPFFLSLFDLIPSFFYTSSDMATISSQTIANKSYFYEERFGLFSGREVFYIRQTLYLFYFILIGRLIFKTGIIQRRDWKLIQHRWIVFVSISIFFLQLSRAAIAIFTDGTQPINSLVLSATGIVSTLITSAIVLFLIYNPRVLYGFILIGKENPLAAFNAVSFSEDSQHEKISRKIDFLSLEQKDEYIKSILNYISDDKPFLNPDFRISHIAEKINIPVHHCSYILNYELNKNFRDWINGYRIQYFIEQFLSKSDRMTIEAMAAESGFSTSATFYNAFKKEKGVSPTTFFKQMAN